MVASVVKQMIMGARKLAKKDKPMPANLTKALSQNPRYNVTNRSRISNQMFKYAEVLSENSDPVGYLNQQRRLRNYGYVISRIGKDAYDLLRKEDPKYASKLERRMNNVNDPFSSVQYRDKLDAICDAYRERIKIKVDKK